MWHNGQWKVLFNIRWLGYKKRKLNERSIFLNIGIDCVNEWVWRGVKEDKVVDCQEPDHQSLWEIGIFLVGIYSEWYRKH
jgi:hypothetical protein